MPRLFGWLDDRKTWFSLVGEPSPLATAVTTVADRRRRSSTRAELVATLARRHAAVAEAPAPVFDRYLTEIAGCEITDGRVHAPKSTGGPRRSFERQTG
jgi:hypothetical protein